MPEVHVFTEEDMELEADFDDLYWDGCDGDGPSGSDSENDDDPTSLPDNIANWAVSFGISMVALTALLSILHVTHPNLPKEEDPSQNENPLIYSGEGWGELPSLWHPFLLEGHSK